MLRVVTEARLEPAEVTVTLKSTEALWLLALLGPRRGGDVNNGAHGAIKKGLGIKFATDYTNKFPANWVKDSGFSPDAKDILEALK